MAKKQTETVEETAVSVPEPAPSAANLIGAAIEHMTKAAAMLRSKGGKKAESCAYVAGQLEHFADQLEKLDNE